MVMFSRRKESGAVSLFLVVFAMLLITVVTLGFLRIMLNDQQQASDNDLSKSAYDSSLAGVEDAKRELIYYRTVCGTGDTALCNAIRNRINSDVCNVGVSDVVDVTANKEVLVQQQQSANDKNLNQAYTCVKINLDTPDYLGTIQANTSKLIPLTSSSEFTTVKIEWYSEDDLGAKTKTVNLLNPAANETPLYLQSNWVAARPSLMRAQLMQVGSSFTLSDFDVKTGITQSNADTVFLYPTGQTGVARNVVEPLSFNDDIHQDPSVTGPGSPEPVRCSGNLDGGGYACSVELELPQAVGQSGNARTAYLRLTPFYNATHFRISLGQGAEFNGVQPSIDSTGRANDLYRRVESRVDLINTTFPFPEAAVDLTGNLCKDFLVTDRAGLSVNRCEP